jgi:glycosyltransferase involved in cell wall biosynthesis
MSTKEHNENLILSIIIPVLITKNNDMQNYLQRCIDSLKAQIDLEKFKDNFEVIVVDDKSYDQTLIDGIDFGVLNHKIIKNEVNLGIGGARNAGLEQAEGKFIWYFDGDDFFSNTAISRFLNVYFEYKDKVDIQLFFTQFSSISKIYLGAGKTREETQINEMKLPDYSCSPVSSCCKIIRKDKCIRHPEKVYMEDVVFNFKQLDQIDGPGNIIGLTNGSYWTYDLRRESNFTTTSKWLQVNRLTIEQHLANQPLIKQKLKHKSVSDLFRVCADLWDLIPRLEHDNIKQAAMQRLMNITDKIKCNNYTH